MVAWEEDEDKAGLVQRNLDGGGYFTCGDTTTMLFS